jgi:protein-L-isoaspartate(D-aspartate) O-methyltransferase
MDREGELSIIRAAYAKQILAAASVVDDARLEAALSATRREDFLGPGPCRMLRRFRDYVTTPDADPVYLYTDDLVGILPERNLNNGQPSLHAHLIHQASPAAGDHVVHIGTGTGYYTAILAYLAGSSGRVTGIEHEPDLPRAPRPISQATPTSRSSRATARWFRSIKPPSSTSMPAARGRPKAGSIASPMAGA